MFGIFSQGGPFGWLLLLLLIFIVVLAITRFTQLNKAAKITAQINLGIKQILWAGFLSFFVGMLGSIYGIYIASQFVSAASEISPQIVFAGFSAALSTTILGIVILIISMVLWLFLKIKSTKLNS